MSVKRIFDFFAALTGLLVLSPFLLIISISILIFMPGSIFFRQLRVGKDGRMFRLIKFRTMKSLSGASDGRFDPGDTSRVTWLGSLLRKYKLDELPQLLNVVKGDMSLVGPRPEIKKWTEFYPEKWEIALKVPPGITDNASIVFRDEEELLARSENPEQTYRDVILPHKLDLYISYVNNHSLPGDIRIIFRTLNIILKR